MSTWVFGDIHGAGREFKHLVEEVIKPVSGDRLIAVGDCFDRGMDGRLVWETMRKWGIEQVRGNHENKMLKYLLGQRDSLPPHYYYALDKLYGIVKRDDLVAYLDGLPLILKVSERALVTHGGVCVEDPWREEYAACVYGNLVYQRPMPRPKGDGNEYWWDKYKLDEPLVVYGHLSTGDGKPRYRHGLSGGVNSVGIDTSVVHGGPMTGYCIETGDVVQYQSGVDWYGRLKQEIAKRPLDRSKR